MQIEFPWPLGATVYVLSQFKSGVLEEEITGYTVRKHGLLVHCTRDGHTIKRAIPDLGISWFPTRELAEQKLAKERHQ